MKEVLIRRAFKFWVFQSFQDECKQSFKGMVRNCFYFAVASEFLGWAKCKTDENYTQPSIWAARKTLPDQIRYKNV